MKILNNLINIALSGIIVAVVATALCIVSSLVARADFIDMKQVSVGYKSFFPGGTDIMVTNNGQPNRELDKEISLNINTDLANFLYFDNAVTGRTDQIKGSNSGQFRTVGWAFKFGVRLSRAVEFGYAHHSQHVLDHEGTFGHWPVEDALELKIYLYRSPTYREPLF